jgi:hypothetical protein
MEKRRTGWADEAGARPRFTDEKNPDTRTTKHDRSPGSEFAAASPVDFRGGKIAGQQVEDRGDRWGKETEQPHREHEFRQPSGIASEKNLAEWAAYASHNSPTLGYRKRD